MKKAGLVAACGAVGALFLVLRWPLYTTPGLVLGWNSDSALLGLIGRSMATGSDVPVFFWGQHYLGTLTSLLTVPLGAGHGVGPLELRIAAALEVAAAILLFALAIRRNFGQREAWLVTVLLVTGPAFLFAFTIAPLAVEQLLLMAALLFWLVTSRPMTSSASWFTAGAIFGLAMWLHQGVMFLGAAIFLALWRERLLSRRRIVAGVAGSIVGYLPAAVLLLRDDVQLYARAISDWSVVGVLDSIRETLRSDLWLLLTAPTRFGVVAGVVVIAFAILGYRRTPLTRATFIAAWTIVISLAFWIFSTYPYAGAVRYIAPALVMIYALAAAGLCAWWDVGGARRGLAALAIVSIVAFLTAGRWQDAREVAAGRREQYTNWPGGFDPRPVLSAMRSGGYEVCYGQVWVAHKLEFLSDPVVRFVVVQSVHRTLPQSLRLIREPGRKCFVENDGRMRELSDAEEAVLRESVLLRARKAHLLLQ